jgi:hypothetical protein
MMLNLRERLFDGIGRWTSGTIADVALRRLGEGGLKARERHTKA